MKLAIGTFILITISGVMMMGCSSLGTRPKKDDKTRFSNSKHYNQDKGVFVNRRQGLIDEMKKRMNLWKITKEFFKERETRIPSKKLPEVKPDLNEFLKADNRLKSIWFGHSSFMLNMDGKIILVDPVFGEAASPVSFMVRRFQAPVLKLEELPQVDYIVISHDHYDHLDMPTIKHFRNKKTKFITPLGVGRHIIGWGIDKERVIEKDWWESAQFDGVEFVATPAQHFSGRNGVKDNETLWASWVIKSANHNVYFSGDSGYDIHFKEIGERLGPFDVAFLESGQYDQRWKEVHMLPQQAVQAFKDLNAKKYFPVHWGMFELAFHKWNEPIEIISGLNSGQEMELVVPQLGELVDFSRPYSLEKWWLN